MSKSPTCVSPKEVGDWIVNRPDEISIVDVRDVDFFGDKVVGSRNIPHNAPLAYFDLFAKEMKNRPIVPKRIFFHCNLCEDRGPTTAEMFIRRCQNILPNTEICYIEGGWQGWKNYYKDDPTFIEPIPREESDSESED
ncbi:hypothetical protein BLNAU_1807 [Blattamonas nauphoetae]|uniref:Rhodanese domain-containing protein n=1 Tax=Blattamonas nauphoetae TaxID=2049346 RepID=A0ABQ9YI59_9EUKA|nr:hypothetical protein BLNAU_1807 [Blattamonas nauphoetae]